MRRPLITVVSANYNDSIFKAVMLFAFKELTRNPYKVIILDNGSSDRDVSILKKLCQEYNNVQTIYHKQSISGSYGHGEALDTMINMVDTEFTVVMDSDCTFLINEWDDLLLGEINEKVKMIGTTSPVNRAGHRIGGGDFPLPFATMFETVTYRKLNISCLPRDIYKGEDTAWEWKNKLLSNGYLGKTFITKNTRDYKEGPFGHLTGIEEYYTESGALIASHFGRGSAHGIPKFVTDESGNWQKLIQTVDPYLGRLFAKPKAEKEMKLWLEKCYQIIDAQADR